MSKDSPKLKQISKSPYKASWWEQFKALLWRSWLAVVKEPMIMKVRFIQTIMIALMLGVIYLGQDSNSRAGVMNINGALFLLLTNMTFSNMFAVVQASKSYFMPLSFRTLSNWSAIWCASRHSGPKLHAVLPDCRNIQAGI